VVSTIDVRAELEGSIRPLRRSEYDRLVELGVFEDEPIELLEGVLVEMSPEGASHAWVIQELVQAFSGKLAANLRLRVGNPLAASKWSEPEPDLAIVPVGDYRRAHPGTAILLIEVARTSRRKDLGVKAAIYAAAGVPEYWVFDLDRAVVHRHRLPTSDGYDEIVVHGPDATLDACGVDVPLGDLIGEISGEILDNDPTGTGAGAQPEAEATARAEPDAGDQTE